MDSETFFNGWHVLLRTAVMIAVAYPGMLCMVRLSGHRTLSQLNAFDLIVTIALGSTLASVITAKDVALAQGLLAFGLLIGLQFALAWLATRSKKLEHILNGEPVLLLHKGQFLGGAMRRARITDEEIKAIVRSQGHAGLDDVAAVVLETNGKLSVVQGQTSADASAMIDILRNAASEPSGQ